MIKQPVPMPEPLLSMHNLRFAWRSDLPDTLYLEQLQVQPGERLFIRGPSGSGKSTLLSLIAGVNLPDSGALSVLGTNLPALSGARRDHFRADHIGFIFQQFNLLPYLSVTDNVVLTCRFSKTRKQRAEQQSETVQAEAQRLLSHLEIPQALWDSQVTELSIGQQQRVAAARALIGRPELLIADEPTSALDSDLREGFITLLFQECEQAGTTLLFVSHDRGLEPLFDRTICLSEINQAV